MAVDKGNDHEKYRGLGGGREGHGVLSSPLKDVGVRAGDWATDLIPYNLNLQKKNFFLRSMNFISCIVLVFVLMRSMKGLGMEVCSVRRNSLSVGPF